MKSEIENFITDLFQMDRHDSFEFKTLYGFTFVFKRTIFEVNGNISSEELSPAGIIFEENDEIYFALLDETIKIETIVEEFVKDCLK